MTWHINNEMNDLEEVKEEMISDTSTRTEIIKGKFFLKKHQK
jgi:hypothetical protein